MNDAPKLWIDKVPPKTIALLSTWLDGWYQSQLWRGAVAATRAHGCRLLTLVGYARPGSIMPCGPSSIMGLAGRPQIDGILLSAGPLSFWEGPNVLKKILSWLPPISVVSLGQTLENVDSVVPDGGGISELVHHMIEAHACRKIVFLAGPPLNPDAQRRLDDYRVSLEAAGIAYDPQLVEVGGFHLEGGIDAMERVLERGARFDAVIAANDTMAIAAAKVLRDHGIRVPTDVRISGYDDTLEGRYQQPPLSTVSNPTHLIAYRGLEMCLDRISNPNRSQVQDVVPVEVMIRKSCGCLHTAKEPPANCKEIAPALLEEALALLFTQGEDKHGDFLHWIQFTLLDRNLETIDEVSHLLHVLASEVAKRCSPEQMPKLYANVFSAQQIVAEANQALICGRLLSQESLLRDLYRTTNALLAHSDPELMIENLAECLRYWSPEGVRLFMINKDFSPTESADLVQQKFEFRIEIRNGKITPIPVSEDLLPEEVIAGEIWTGVPIEQGTMHFGVVLFRNWDCNESFVEQLRLIFSIAFSISWRTRSESRLSDALHRLSVRDELTGLYNRRGLFEVANVLTNQATRDRKKIGVIYADLDRLKEINDKFGHADGDLAISTFADALRVCFRSSDVLARLGGDEFAAVFILNDASEHASILSRLHTILHEHSLALGKAWKVSASVGWSIWDCAAGSSLENEMLKADQKLYEDKANRKTLGLR